MDHWVGLDLGSHVDYTAVSVLTRSLAINPATRMPMRDSRGCALYDWRLRAIHRFSLRTPYTEVADKAAKIAAMPELMPQPRVVVDSTGMGAACTEMVRTALRPYPDIELWGISITAGEGWRVVGRQALNCSKVQLVGAFREVLESGRFRVCKQPDGKPIPGAEVLKRELAAFKVKVSRLSNMELFGADSGQHDDCVLSVSLPVWAGSLPFMRMREMPEGDGDPHFRPRESAALAAEERAIRQAEEDAILREQDRENERMRAGRLERERLAHEDPDNDIFWT
jgi:hypothetical protein